MQANVGSHCLECARLSRPDVKTRARYWNARQPTLVTYALILTSRFNEVQKHLSNTAHFFDFIAVVASKKAFEQLKPEHQKAVREAMISPRAGWRCEAMIARCSAISKSCR